MNNISRWFACVWWSKSSYYHFIVVPSGSSQSIKIASKEDWEVAEVKHVLTFIRLVKSEVWQNQ